MTYSATLKEVPGHGAPPTDFLDKVVAWARGASRDIVAINTQPNDVMGLLRQIFPWQGTPQDKPWLQSRLASIMELMRVHAAWESDWNWHEGVDETNERSLAQPECREAGIFQVSFDSTGIHNGAMRPFAIANNINDPELFQTAMKSNPKLALEYYTRLVRVSYCWAGPLLDPAKVRSQLSVPAYAEFLALLK